MYGSPKPIPDRLSVPDTLPDERCCFCQIFCPPHGRRLKTPRSNPAVAWLFWRRPGRPALRLLRELNGAEQIFIIDHNDYRLDFAQQRYGAIPINFDHHDDPAQWIIDNTPGHRGVDAVIDAVGFEAKVALRKPSSAP